MEAIPLLTLTKRIAALIQKPETQNIWITAELSDVAVRSGHCYMELLEKDDRGLQLAKARGVIWANRFAHIDAQFYAATGQRFASGLKVMLCVSASMHPIYGLSLVVNDVNPEFTMGDLLRRRREILERLHREGILELNKQLQWPQVPQRIAVISAPGAAGYGDFINQLYSNPSRLRFFTKLYPAIMQGASAPASIVTALERIAMEADEMQWDGVAIIRGGGATSDLQAFEDYNLAANVAQFPLPVAIGIGHERDITVLDWVANMRLKTPTAVAEWLITTGENTLAQITRLGNSIVQCATDRLSGCKEQIAYFTGLLPSIVNSKIERNQLRLQQATSILNSLGAAKIQPCKVELEMKLKAIADAAIFRLKAADQKLNACNSLLAALSPQATLLRGYTITSINGKAVTDPAHLHPGDVIVTTFASGTTASTVK